MAGTQMVSQSTVIGSHLVCIEGNVCRLAITTGSTAEFEGTQKKIQNGYVFKVSRASRPHGQCHSDTHVCPGTHRPCTRTERR